MEDKSPTPKPVSLKLSVPTAGFRRSMRFNRVHIEKMDGCTLLHFGLVDERDGVRDMYSAVIEQGEIDAGKESMLEFLQKIGQDFVNEPKQWLAPTTCRNIELVRFMFMGNRATGGEIALLGFCVGSAMQRPKEDITPDPLALLSCETDFLRYIISEIYLEKSDANN